MRSVPIQVYKRDVPEPENAGWGLGFWNRFYSFTEEGEFNVWGLTLSGFPTQMCYGMDYANPYTVSIERRKKNENDPHSDWLRWYFDVGRKLYVTLDDLEAAFEKLRKDETT